MKHHLRLDTKIYRFISPTYIPISTAALTYTLLASSLVVPQATTNYNTHHTGTSNCKIKIVADRNGMIIHTEYDGDWVACEAYADRLARY